MPEDIVVTVEEMEEELGYRLERKPTTEELERFIEYLRVDVPQWLVDKAKCFVRDVLDAE